MYKKIIFTSLFLIIVAITTKCVCSLCLLPLVNLQFKQEKAIDQAEQKTLASEVITKEQENTVIETTSTEILKQIDTYQEKYFTLIKKNHVLLMLEDNEIRQNDLKELDALFYDVKNKIKAGNYYLKKYDALEKEYSINTGETTIEINDFIAKEYQAFDDLLNEVYQAVKQKIPSEDFKNLIISEKQWLKNVEAYHKYFERESFGTISTQVNLGYEINMRKFRTLLLMLYL